MTTDERAEIESLADLLVGVHVEVTTPSAHSTVQEGQRGVVCRWIEDPTGLLPVVLVVRLNGGREVAVEPDELTIPTTTLDDHD